MYLQTHSEHWTPAATNVVGTGGLASVLASPLILVGLLLLLAFAFQGTRGIWEPDEGRYTDVALEMLDTGDYLVPHLDEEHEHYTKPPLTYWALAASVRIFGRNEWAARLPNAIAFILTGLAVWGLSKRLLPDAPGAGPLVWATMLGPAAAANVITTDTLLTLWETLAMLFCVEAVSNRGVGQRRAVHLMWLGWGLAFLTKGPPGLLPLLGVSAALLLARQASTLRVLFRPAGLVTFALVGGSWYAWVAVKHPDLVRYFAAYEIYDRLFTGVHQRHPEWYGAFLVYGRALAVSLLPWSAFAALAIGRPGWHLRATRWSALRVDRDRLLLLAWLALPLLVFLLARSRLPLYILPLHVPIALLIARSLVRRGVWFTTPVAVLLVAAALSIVSLKAAAAYLPRPERDARHLAQELGGILGPGSLDELVFVDAKPAYGLKLYLHTEIELSTLAPVEQMFPSITPPHDVCHELREPYRSVFMVRDEALDTWQRALAHCGEFESVRIGRAGHFDVMRVRARPASPLTLPRPAGDTPPP